MVTIKDIAREAGVSHGTVSNVLNKTGKVSTEKIRLVEEAAKRLGYVPNTQAQLLRQGSVSNIVLIIPSLKEEACLNLYASIQASFNSHGYNVMAYTTDDIAENELSILRQIPLSNLLAIITISCLQSNSSESPYSSVPCPVIFIDRKPSTLRSQDNYIAFDNKIISQDLAAYIRKKGYRRIAFFTPPGSISDAKIIYESVRNHLPHNIELSRFSSDIHLSLPKAFDIILSGTPFEVVITNGMLRADAVLNAIELSNAKQPPKIIALSPLSRMPGKQLNIYELDYSQIGAQIAQILLKTSQDRQFPDSMILHPKGFPFTFPNLKKLESETLSLLTIDAPSTTALKKLSPMLQKATGIKLKIISMPYQDLHQQIELIDKEHYFDLIRMDIAQMDHLGQNAYLPMSSAGIDASFFPSELIYNLHDQSFVGSCADYAIPFDPCTQIFLYRKDLFENATLSRHFYETYHKKLTIPSTMKEYLQVAEFFSREFLPTSPTQYGATMTCGSAASTSNDFLPYLLATLDQAPNREVSREVISQALTEYCQMTSYTAKQAWWMDSLTQFMNGEVATTIIYSNYASYAINSKYSKVVGKTGAAVIPGRNPLIGGGVVGICRHSQKLEACRQFFRWYYSPDICSLLVKLGGTSPLSESYSDVTNLEVFPWLSSAKESFELATRGMHKKSDYSIYEFEFTLGTAVRNLITGIMSLDEALEFIQPVIQ